MRTAACGVVKRDPVFADFRNIQDELGKLFASGLPRVFGGEEVFTGKWSPNVDIFETDSAIVLEADLPGMKADDFNLSIENYRLTLTGERKFEKESKGENWHRVERNYGTFTRTFTLPNTVNVDGVKAEFKDGVLVVTLPKREEVKARNINVTIKTDTNGSAN
ncbi:MAG: Hsp20/alpha crystallin family protein [Acidobacteriota bacterium]|nr:Hsp20/alpha crystallin family protein [Acidobacteriota bacterium]